MANGILPKPKRAKTRYISRETTEIGCVKRSQRVLHLSLKTLYGYLSTATTAQINDLIHQISTHRRNSYNTIISALRRRVRPIDLKWGTKPWWYTEEWAGCWKYLNLGSAQRGGFRLGDLPPELREMIFNYADLEWTTPQKQSTEIFKVPRAMPPLIIALRGTRYMYFKALKIFHHQAVYVFEHDSPWNYGKMGNRTKAFQTIRKAKHILYVA